MNILGLCLEKCGETDLICITTFFDNFVVTYKVKSKQKMSQSELDQCKAGMNAFYTANIEPAANAFKTTDTSIIAMYLGAYPQKIEELKGIYAKAEEEHKNLEITEGYSLTIEFKFKGSSGTAKSKSKINVIKMNGKWTFDYFTSGNGNAFAFDGLIE